MSAEDTPEEALAKIVKQSQDVIGTVATQLHTDLIKAAPVDTGHFRRSWRIRQRNDWQWRISNSADYASILWRGRRIFRNHSGNPQWYGSEQWQAGGDPMIAQANVVLSRELDKIEE